MIYIHYLIFFVLKTPESRVEKWLRASSLASYHLILKPSSNIYIAIGEVTSSLNASVSLSIRFRLSKACFKD